MADLKISDLSALSGGDLVAADELAIVDDSASETKKITVSNLIANGVTLISDDAIPGAKILFGAGDIATAALADSAVTAAKIGADQVTAAKIADNTIVNLVSTLPTSGDYTGQLALDTDDNSLYVYSGSAWLNTKAPGSVNAFTDTTSGIINISTAVSSGTATVTASIDNTASAAQFLAGPVGSAGTVGYRTIDGGDLPTATTTSKGGVIVNGGGLILSTDTIQIDNSVTASSTKHLVTYDANGLISGGSVISSSDLPVATSSAKGAVIASDGLAVDASGNLSIDNTVTAGTYTKVTVTSKGVVSSGDTLAAADIPDHSAAKLTSGTIGSSLIANDSVTADKLANESTVKFGGALGSDNVTIFPAGDFKGQLFWDETSLDLYVYTGSAFIPITVLSGNLVNAGTYNANTNLVSSITTAGSSAGFAVGSALPAPVGANLNHYVVVDTSGTGTGAAPSVALAPPDMLLSQGVGTEYSLIDVSNAIAGQTASNISFIASGTIAATDVQAALQEVDTEKLPKAGGTMTGDLNLGTSTNVVFEGSSADDYETTLTVTNPTADRTITFPNITGTVVTTGDTGSVTSTMIADGAIVNADINASAEIAVSKLANGTARQLLQTDSGGSGVEFTSNVDVPGTLDVTSGATFDSTVAVTGLLSANGKLAYPAGSAAAVSLYSGTDTDTGIYSPGSNEFGISTAGTPRIVVDASGKVGIGTDNPQAKLDITASAAGIATAIFLNNFTGTTGGSAINAGRALVLGADALNNSGSDASYIAFETDGDERMRIDSSGNVGIGDSAPNGNYGTNLSVHSTATNGARVKISDGTTGKGNTDGLDIISTGGAAYFINRENSFMSFTTNSIEGLRIDSSGDVQVGATTSNGAKFKVSDSGAHEFAFFPNDSGANSLVNFNRSSAAYVDMSIAAKEVFFKTGTSPSDKMKIDSSGRLLINRTNSTGSHNLEVFGGTDNEPIKVSSSDAGAYILFADNDTTGSTRLGAIDNDLKFDVNSNERMRIDSSGRVIIGTAGDVSGGDDDVKLQVASAAGPSIQICRTDSTTTANELLGRIFASTEDGGTSQVCGQITFRADGSHTTNDHPTRMEFSTCADQGSSATERMRINREGGVSIYADDVFPLQVRSANGANSSTDRLIGGRYSATNTTSGTLSFQVWTNGNVQNTNDSYGQISDVKLKENIVDAGSQWEDFKAVRFRKYNFKEETGYETHTQLGVIAQELELTSPGLVYETADKDEDENDLGTTTKAVKSSILTKKALVALQEAMARIETLEQRLSDAGIA